MSNAEMDYAIGTILNQYWGDERKHFFESWRDQPENPDKETFIGQLYCHTFYALIVLSYNGNAEEIKKEIDDLWDEFNN